MFESSSDNNLSSESEYTSESEESSSKQSIPTCLYNYTATMQALPHAMSRQITKISEIDVKIHKNFQELDNIKSLMKNSIHSKNESLQVAKRKFNRILTLEEMKTASVKKICDMLEKSVGSFEGDHTLSLSLKSLETESPSYSGPEDPDSGPQEEETEEEGDRKPIKRGSSSSRGRGRRSLPRSLVTEDDLDTSSLSRTSLGPKRKTRKRRGDRKSSPGGVLEVDAADPDEPRYCSCNEISYGEMIGCDNNDCPIEWFHFRCVNLTAKPKGNWFCPRCAAEKKKNS